MSKKVRTIYEIFNQYSKEQIDEVIKSLTKYDKELLAFRYGSDLENPTFQKPMSCDQRKHFYSYLIIKIKRRLNENIKIRREYWLQSMSIYEYFNDYSKKEIDKMVSKLKGNDKKLLELRCGSNLEYPVMNPSMTKEQKEVFSRLTIPRMKNMLENPTKKYEFFLTKCHTYTIYEYFNEYTQEQVDVALKKIGDRERELLELRFSSADVNNGEKMSKKEAQSCYRILKKIEKLLKEPTFVCSNKPGKPLKSIYEYFSNYTKNQIDSALEKLTEEEKELMKLRYGNDLENPVSSDNWTKECYTKFYKYLIPKLKKMLQNPNYGIVKARGPVSIYNYFNEYPKERIDEMLKLLPADEQKLVKLKYGDDLENPVTSPTMTDKQKGHFRYIMESRMRRLLENPNLKHEIYRNIYSGLYGYFYDATKEQIDRAVEDLDIFERKILKDTFGDNLDNVLVEQIESMDKNHVCYQILKKLKGMLQLGENIQVVLGRRIISIYEYFSDYTKEQVNRMLSTLSEKEKRLLRLKYGDNLEMPFTSSVMTKAEKKQFSYLLSVTMNNRLKQIVTVEQENAKIENEHIGNDTLTRTEICRIRQLLHTQSYLELLQKYSTKEALVLFMRLGFVDGKTFSIGQIAKFLQIESQEVMEILRKYLLHQKEELQLCVVESLTLEEKDGEMVKRLPNRTGL